MCEMEEQHAPHMPWRSGLIIQRIGRIARRPRRKLEGKKEVFSCPKTSTKYRVFGTPWEKENKLNRALSADMKYIFSNVNKTKAKKKIHNLKIIIY